MEKHHGKLLKSAILFLAIGVICGVGLAICSVTKDDNNIGEDAENDLPVMKISLATSLEEMKAGEKSIEYNGNHLWINDEDFGEITIKGRGNTTWTQDKKPWQIEFEEEVELLGITSTKKWVLLAGVLDKSHLRDYLALEFESMIDNNGSRGQFVEVEFDGEYEGIFYLTPKIAINKGMVDLKDKFGVLVEIDNMRLDSEYYTSYGGNRLFLKDAVMKKDNEIRSEAMADFLKKYNLLEKAILEKDYATITELADVKSFAKAYLVNEFAVDPDAYKASYFLYKDGLEDKIHVGPMWDFDYAFGNLSWPYVDSLAFYSPRETMVRKREFINENGELDTVIMMFYLMEIPEFQDEVKKMFQERLSGRGEEFMINAKEKANLIREAVIRDAEKWEYEDYNAEMEYVLEWTEKRYQYFEEVYGGGNDEQKKISVKNVFNYII